ncbi:ABC transporter permease [Streptomyces sp. P38-E01]|uniref:ABC transporter permease n=1 Tax=Streptomyces tardus TaxID=2780544 RepID=A0A949JEF0_9ACTN|nr:ABC transporter permease [Streptomyces tardus]MBU7598436.1 ABC transporter permease [Streptomyces tardus]
MNFVKRAGLSLWARKGRTLITLAAFLVISVMVLAGVLIDGATARAEQDVKQSVGAEVNLEMDLGDLGAGAGMQAPRIDAGTVDELGRLPQVQKYTYEVWDRAILDDGQKLVGGGPQNPMGEGGTVGMGVLDTSLLPDFRSGRFTLLSGEHLTSADRDRKRLLIEERFAKENGLKVGDRISLTGNDEKTEADFTVAGVYRDSRPTDEPDAEYGISPANMLYGSVGGLGSLSSENENGLQVSKATFLLQGAEAQEAFEEAAEKEAGSELDGFALAANDKAIAQMTGPLDSIRGTATAAMWLMGLAGAAVLALLANLAVKQQRKEYGVLLAMGERKSSLIAQQALEVVLVATVAIGLGSLLAPALTQSAGQALLGREAAAAEEKLDSWQPPPPGSTGIGEGIDMDDRPVENADPVDRITVALSSSDLATVGAVGLGVGVLATAIPAAAVLRLNPRAILTKGK